MFASSVETQVQLPENIFWKVWCRDRNLHVLNWNKAIEPESIFFETSYLGVAWSVEAQNPEKAGYPAG